MLKNDSLNIKLFPGDGVAVAGGQGEGQGRRRRDGEELLNDAALFHDIFLQMMILGGR